MVQIASFAIGLLFLWLPVGASGQSVFQQEYRIRHYDISAGLPVNSVNGMVQDDEGYLYITTYDGLVRYDGYTFKIYNSGGIEGMETNRIGGLLKGVDNSIWLFNEDGSITQKKGEHFRTYHSPQIPGHSSWMIESSDGRIWVSGSEGLAYFDENSSQFTRLSDSLLLAAYNVVGAGLHGEIYAVNQYGLISWKNGEVSHLLNTSDYPMLFTETRQIRQFKEDVVWLMGSRLLIRLDVAKNETQFIDLEPFSNAAFWNMHQKSDGEYILTASTGFYVLREDALALQQLSVPVNSNLSRNHIVFEGQNGEEVFIGDDEVIIDGNTVLEVPSIKFGFIDREGSLWVGSETDGLYQIRKSSFINLTQAHIEGLSNVYSVIQDRNGAIWSCSLNSGITQISGTIHKNWNEPGGTGNCKFLFEDTDGTLYAGFEDNSIRIFDGENWFLAEPFRSLETEFIKAPEAMHRSGQKLYIGHLKSLLVFENGSIRLFDETQPRALAGVQVMVENSKGVIFAGTSGNGLSRIEHNTYRRYSKNEGYLNSDIIRDIYLQSDDTLWIATENIGLNRLILDENGAVLSSVSITRADGLRHNSLHRIIDDGLGNLWLSSNGGIMRIPQKALNNFADGKIPNFPGIHFDEKDGMINREANGGVQSAGVLTAQGQLWFPNQHGITIINPRHFQTQQMEKPLLPIIENIETGNGFWPVIADSVYRIPKNQRDLRVNFTAPNFVYQERVHFSYMLEGVNATWQSATQARQAVFTALPPGLHRLKVRAGYTNSEPAEAVITLSVPYKLYETPWFLGLMLMGAAAFIWAAFKYRIRHLQARENKLQQRVDEQTRELQKATEQKTRFFTGITHELKTPLALIMGPLDDMAEEPEKITLEQLKTRLPLMHRNSLRLKQMVDQILDVSKLNADAMQLTLRPVHLSELSRRIAGQFQSWLAQKALTLHIEANPVHSEVYVDPDAWERILINLLSNAIKFSPEGKRILLEINDLGDDMQVSLQDEGLGIPANKQQKVFEYLYQVGGDNAAGGTGVGLFLVKGLVEKMGGTISLQSEPGKGSKFIITLKKGYAHFDTTHTIRHEILEASENKLQLKKRANPIHDSTRSGKTTLEQILVVEDNADFRDYLSSILQTKYSVLTAANGKEGLALLATEIPDLIISDVMMPGMDGLEFVHTLRKEDRFRHLPVIFLTAKNHETDIETGLSTGADIYLTKPTRTRMLLSQIEAVLRRERVLRGQEFYPAEKEESEFVRKVRELIYRQLANPLLGVDMLADALYISRATLYASWKREMDITLNTYIKKLRLAEAKILLTEKRFNVQEAARAVGYMDANYFSTSFKKEFGISPSDIKR